MTTEYFNLLLIIDKLIGALFVSWSLFFMYFVFNNKLQKIVREKEAEWINNAIDYGEWIRVNETTRTVQTINQTTKSVSYQRANLSPSVRFDIMKRDRFSCQLCGKTMQDGIRLEVDHKMPVSKGGGNHPGNLWTLCNVCNSGKSNKIVPAIVEEFAEEP